MPRGGSAPAAPTTRVVADLQGDKSERMGALHPACRGGGEHHPGLHTGDARKVNRFCTVLEIRQRRPGKHSLPRGENPIRNNGADVAELVDARDLKSLDGNVVWVRVPPPAPTADRNPGAHRQPPSRPIPNKSPSHPPDLRRPRRRQTRRAAGAGGPRRSRFHLVGRLGGGIGWAPAMPSPLHGQLTNFLILFHYCDG